MTSKSNYRLTFLISVIQIHIHPPLNLIKVFVKFIKCDVCVVMNDYALTMLLQDVQRFLPLMQKANENLRQKSSEGNSSADGQRSDLSCEVGEDHEGPAIEMNLMFAAQEQFKVFFIITCGNIQNDYPQVCHSCGYYRSFSVVSFKLVAGLEAADRSEHSDSSMSEDSEEEEEDASSDEQQLEQQTKMKIVTEDKNGNVESSSADCSEQKVDSNGMSRRIHLLES